MASSVAPRPVVSKEEGAIRLLVASERTIRPVVCPMIIGWDGYINPEARCFAHRAMPGQEFNLELIWHSDGDHDAIRTRIIPSIPPASFSPSTTTRSDGPQKLVTFPIVQIPTAALECHSVSLEE